MKTGDREFSSPLYRVLEDTRAVSPDDAMFDLCSMSIGLPNIAGTESQTLRVLKALSLLKIDIPGSGPQRLFSKRNLMQGRHYHAFKVVEDQKGEGMIFPHPTFSGLLTANRETVPPKDPFAPTTWVLLLNVCVSINRAIQAQTLSIKPRSKRVRRIGPYSLFLSERAAGQVDERLLVPATNILDRSELRLRYADSQYPEDHLREFVTELVRACSAPFGRSGSFQPSVNISTLEVNWDFYDENPIITVELIRQKSTRIAKALRARYAPQSTMVEGLKLNSPSVMLELIEGLQVRFYAKSPQTVRFEVVYGAERIKHFKPQKGMLTLEQAMQTARKIRHDAAIHMNTILSLMREENKGREDDATTAELIRAVLAAFPDVIDARNILVGLANYRRIRTFPKDPRLPGLRKLKKLSVLECDPASPGRRNYVATPRFEAARSQLMFTQAMPRRLWVKPRPRHLRGGEK